MSFEQNDIIIYAMCGLTRLTKHMKLYREDRGQFSKPVRVSIINDSKPHRRWIKDDHRYAVLMNQTLKPSGKFSSVLFVIKAAKAVAPTAFCKV